MSATVTEPDVDLSVLSNLDFASPRRCQFEAQCPQGHQHDCQKRAEWDCTLGCDEPHADGEQNRQSLLLCDEHKTTCEDADKGMAMLDNAGHHVHVLSSIPLVA